MTATCGSCEDEAVFPSAFRRCCRERRGSHIFSTDPVLEGTGRGERWFLRHEIQKWNQIKVDCLFSEQLRDVVSLVAPSEEEQESVRSRSQRHVELGFGFLW